MKINITDPAPGEPPCIEISAVYSGAMLRTSEGNRVGFCMRDDTIEFNVLPASGGGRWFRIDMQSLEVLPMEAASDKTTPLPGMGL